MDLEVYRRTLALWKGTLEVSQGLEQWVGVRALRRCLLAAKPASQMVQMPAQFSTQPIDGLQGERQAWLFRRRFERRTRQQWHQPLPYPSGAHRVPGQNLSQKNAKAAPTAAAPAAIAAPDPLATEAAALGP